MFEILVGTTPTANQEVFGVAKGTQASNTPLFTIDEDGDTYIGNRFATGTGTLLDSVGAWFVPDITNLVGDAWSVLINSTQTTAATNQYNLSIAHDHIFQLILDKTELQ